MIYITKEDKKRIKEILKEHGETMIAPSWFLGEARSEDVIFRTYDKNGSCYEYYLSKFSKFARRQSLNAVMIHERLNVDYMFEDIFNW